MEASGNPTVKKTSSALIRFDDVLGATALLTRLPVPAASEGRAAEAAWAYPVAGLFVGAAAGLAGALGHWAGLPATLCALVALAALVAATGALHEDGLADTADGLWGGWTPQRRLEIMRDSRIGAYGALALMLSLAARWAALSALYEAGPGAAAAAIIAAAALSRAAMPAMMWALPPARDSGMSAEVGEVPGGAAILAAALAGAAALVLVGWEAPLAALWAAAAAGAAVSVARERIGGHTGDTVGATQQIAEIAVLLSIVA